MTPTPRARAQAIARQGRSGRGDGRHTLAVPLALRLAAKICERPWEEFTTDPTQLANGLADLLEAVRPDGVTLMSPGAGVALDAAVEATRRLRTTVRDEAVLIAVLAPDGDLLDTVTALLDAGIDGVVLDGALAPDLARTVGNMARFHRVMAHVLGPGSAGLPGAEAVRLDAPAAGSGLVLTDGEVPVENGIAAVQGWLAGVRGDA